MGDLLNTPSGGQSEVLETLHFQGAIHTGVPLFRLGAMVSARYGGRETREGSDAVFEADLVTVLNTLATAGYVAGQDATGATVDITGAIAPSTTRIVLTATGRVRSRSTRPRVRRISSR